MMPGQTDFAADLDFELAGDPPFSPPDSVPPVDPDAPYGRNAAGVPYKVSPEVRAQLSERLARGRANRGKGAPPKRRTPGKSATATRSSRPRTTTGPDYRPSVAGLLQLPAFGLGMAARFNPVFALDAAALALHTPNIADAVHDLAVNDGRVAAILERITQVGPYGALLTALMPLALQLMANHGLAKPNDAMGILSPEQLVAALGGDNANGGNPAG